MQNFTTPTATILSNRLYVLNEEYNRTQNKFNSIAEQLYDRDWLLDTLMSDNRVKQRYTLNLVHTMLEDSNVSVDNSVVRDMANSIIKFGTITDNSYREYVQLHIDNYYNNDLDIILEPLFIFDNHYQEFQDKLFSLHKEIKSLERALEVL